MIGDWESSGNRLPGFTWIVAIKMIYVCVLLFLGNVIKAWDIGVASMKRGELAVLLCKSEYAYGKSGSGSKIPPDATLVFEVELFDWKGEQEHVLYLVATDCLLMYLSSEHLRV